MKKHFTLFSLSLFLFANAAKAQETITFTEGPELARGVASGEKKYPFAEDKNSFYIRRETPGARPEMWVEKFDKKTLKADYSVKVELYEGKEAAPGRSNFLRLTAVNGNVVIIYDAWSKSDGKKFLYQRTVSSSGVVSERKELTWVECPQSGVFTTNYDATFSNDQSKTLVQLRISQEGLPGKPIIALYDTETGKSNWSKNSVTTYKGAPVYFVVDTLLNDGTCYVSFGTGSKKTNDFQLYKAVIKPGSSDFSDVQEVKLYRYAGDDTKYLYSISELKLSNGLLARAGMYNEKVPNYDPKDPPELKTGVFLSFVDPKTQKVTMENYGLFSDDIRKKLTYKIKGFNTASLYPSDKSIVTNQLVEMDGNFYVIAEHRYTVNVSSDRGSYSYDVQNELIITKFNSSGKFEWNRIIRKGASAYHQLVVNGKLHFFYLESTKSEKTDLLNYSPEDDFPFADIKGSNTICTTLDANGNMVKQVILRPVKDQYYYSPDWAAIPVGSNQLIVRYQFGINATSNAKFGIITVK